MSSENTPAIPQASTIKIQGLSVSVKNVFNTGHSCTMAEALALNQVRRENIRNNLATKARAVKAELEDENFDGDPEEVLTAFQELVTEYAENYEFSLASVTANTVAISPEEKQARALARQMLNNKIQSEGITVKAYREDKGEEAYMAKIVEISKFPDVIKRAKELLAAQEGLNQQGFDL